MLLALAAAATPGSARQASSEPLWEGEAGLSFISTTGNTSTRTLGATLQLEHRPEAWELVGEGAFVRTRSEGELNSQSLALLLRASRAISERLQGYGEVDYLKNRFAGIDHRISPEAGAALQMLEGDIHSLKVLGAMGFIREVRLGEDSRSFASANGGLRYRWRMTSTTEVTDEAGFTANLQEGDDWRIANRAAVSVAISTMFSLRVSHTLEYLNQPVPGFQTTDTRMAVALVARF